MNRNSRALAIIGVAFLVLAAAAPAQAGKPLVHEKYSDSFTFVESDFCGLEVQFDVTARGVFKIMPVRGTDQAFLASNAYHFTEIISTDSGWIRTEGHGQFHEQRATHVEGDVWEFTFKDAGQFSVYDSSGNLLLRANGVFKASEQFDTLGDGEPGAVPVEGTFEVLHTAGPGFSDEEFCAVVTEELT